MRSQERAQDLGEVFTPPEIVLQMLGEVDPTVCDFEKTVFEPACGNGNFLVELLDKRFSSLFETSETQQQILSRSIFSLANLYGVDIDKENVQDCRQRLATRLFELLLDKKVLVSEVSKSSVDEILRANILLGDSLEKANEILFIEYTLVGLEKLQRQYFYLEQPEYDLFFQDPPILEDLPMGAPE